MSTIIAKKIKPLSKKHALRASQLLQNAWAIHQSGHLQEAEAQYLSILKKYPNHCEAMHLLGILARQTGRIDIAIIRFEQTINLKPDFAEAHNNLGDALQNIDKTEEAITHFKQAIRIKPDFAEAHYNLGNCLQRLKHTEQAIEYFKQTIILKPGLVEAHNNLGSCLRILKRSEEAIPYFEQALSFKPDFVEAHYNLGNSLHMLERENEAISHYKQVITLKPDFVEAYYNLGDCLKELGQLEEAALYFEQSIRRKPDYIEAYVKLGNIYKSLGKMQTCIDQFEQAISIKPDSVLAYYNLTLISPKQKNISKIESLLNSQINSAEEANCHYALGLIYDSMKSHSKAFEHFQKSNEINRNFVTYDAEKHSAFVDRLIEFFSEKYFKEKAVYGSESELPVFILGMPRSGTTLVEQILSSHSQVFGAGELPFIKKIEEAIINEFGADTTFPELINLFDKSISDKYADKYLKELAKFEQDVLRVTDKMPGNFIFIGLIKMLFPKARIIHCQRNPIDTCVSIFLNNLKGHAYSRDLTELGKYYLDYERLMRHWCTLFPFEIFNVQYEKLVADQNNISRQLIKYINLEWDEACLDFHKNKRAVRTASNLQVRQPIYTRSVERWKRYEDHLQPLFDILKRQL